MRHSKHSSRESTQGAGLSIPAALLVACTLVLLSCASPNGTDPNIIDLDPDPDTITFTRDSVKVQSSVRFEALVDTTGFPYRQFAGTRLKIGLVCVPPPGQDSVTYTTLTAFSANYLDLPAVGLPLNMTIPAECFHYYDIVRVAVAFVVLFRDADENDQYDIGEAMFGAGENSVYAFVEGRTDRLPFVTSGIPRSGSNLFVRVGDGEHTRFHASPDYSATIFIIQVRGERQPYTLPYPWPVSGSL